MTSTSLKSSILIASSFAWTSGVANAQDEGQASPIATPASTASPANTGLDTRLDAVEKELVALKKQNEELKVQVAETQDSLSQASQDASSYLGKTKIFGFFDTSFVKYNFSKKDSVIQAYVPSTASFMISGLNLYLGNQLTEKLKFLSELHFTYQPLGSVTSRETYYVLPNGGTANLGTSFGRTDTSVSNPLDGSSYRLGGVDLVRVQATYTLSDYLGVTVGRFLTPYGIWNVDHGSPVVLMIRSPELLTQELIPASQLGVQLFGKAFVSNSLVLDYAATVSNGRGPADTVMDLDNNKAVGLRWRLSYESEDLSIALGQFGYTGKYTDNKQAIYVGPGSADYSLTFTPTNQFTEYDLANDLRIQFHGLRIQSEFVMRRVSYAVPPQVSPMDFAGNPATASQHYSASYIGKGIYGLLAYELGEGLLGKGVRLTPFVYYEYVDLNDTTTNRFKLASAGVNIRPLPCVALKLEYDYTLFPGGKVDLMPDGTLGKTTDSTINGFAAQVAVTF